MLLAVAAVVAISNIITSAKEVMGQPAFVCLPLSKITQFGGNVEEEIIYSSGETLDSGGTLIFDLPKIKDNGLWP